jgi:hypothetical protein
MKRTEQIVFSMIFALSLNCTKQENKDVFLEAVESSEVKNENSKSKRKVLSEEEKHSRLKQLRALFKKTGFVNFPYDVNSNYIQQHYSIYNLNYDTEERILFEDGFHNVLAVLPDTTEFFIILHTYALDATMLQMIVYSKSGEVLDNTQVLEDNCATMVGEILECVDRLVINEDLSMLYSHKSEISYEDYAKEKEYDTICAEKNSKGIISANGRITFEKVKMDTLECI